MEFEESLLRPCMSLSPPFNALQNRTSTQGEIVQGVSTPAKEMEGGYMTQEDNTAATQEGKSSGPQKGKGPQAAAIVNEGPLNLLDLPLDILKDIFKEVSAKDSTV